jgi:acetyl esterase/lipase
MALFYLGNSPNPIEITKDYYLSPVLASKALLEQFPPTFFLTGEKDPFVDDTMVFANQLRDAQRFKKGIFVRVQILEGISHGFFQFLSIFPLAAQAVKLTSKWIQELFDDDHLNNEGLSHRDIMDRRRREFADRHL